MGGKSIEREVSLNSGRTISDHLDTSRYDLLPIFQTATGQLFILPWRFLHRGKIADFEHRLASEAEPLSWDDLKTRIDFAFIAMHGRYGEDGCIQGFLEVLGIPYFGSKVLASSLGMDKSLQKEFLKAAKIRVPLGITLYPYEIRELDKGAVLLEERLRKENLSYPLIVKPVNEGSSLGVSKVNNLQELLTAVHKACFVAPQKIQSVIVEETLEGMEFSCIVITDIKTSNFLPLPPTEIVVEKNSALFDYDQKYMPGRAEKHTPARCMPHEIRAIQEAAVQVMNVLGFSNLGRIDGFLLNDGSVAITDPNSFSGMSPSSYAFLQAAEVDMTHTGFINHLIETELHAYRLGAVLNEKNKKMDTDSMKAPEKKIRVGVLLGGSSNEKEISLESGRNVCYKLSPHHYETTPLFISSKDEIFTLSQRLLVRNKTDEIEELLDPTTHIPWHKLPELFDFIFIGLHGGKGENGCVQGTLEMLGLPYNGSPVLASALCMDKYRTNELLDSCGFAIPQHVLINRATAINCESLPCPLGFPVVLKPHDDGCSVLVQRADNQVEFEAALKKIFESKEFALVEELIEGTEVTIGVIGNDKPYALPPSQSIAAKGILTIEEKFLPGAGENQTPANLPPAAIQLVQKTAEEVFKTVGCKGYVRIDCFYQSSNQSKTGKERVVIIEINTLPGLTPATCLFHQAAEIGIKPMDFIDLIVKQGFERAQHNMQEMVGTLPLDSREVLSQLPQRM
ncbi:MAG: ATP-grasp enzyme, D-alanine-D-alanine ligase [candidate division TM6 bacterium GW2011_GWF2_43_87]|nr:MAG: ATP-grasp enzyme, D-alanine-D-alanine ligase [candidate division TM6 bacterium GW2011_GWF2_43_87]